jgi:glutathionyl-hydroquinone reductase
VKGSLTIRNKKETKMELEWTLSDRAASINAILDKHPKARKILRVGSIVVDVGNPWTKRELITQKLVELETLLKELD